jgi:hypothetical protein
MGLADFVSSRQRRKRLSPASLIAIIVPYSRIARRCRHSPIPAQKKSDACASDYTVAHGI